MKIFLKRFVNYFAIFGGVLLSGQIKSNEMMQVIVFCPSVYQVMAPNDRAYFQNSYNALSSTISMEASMAGLPVNYYIEKNLGSLTDKKMESVDDLVSAITSNIREELDQGKINEVQLEELMGICPIFWE